LSWLGPESWQKDLCTVFAMPFNAYLMLSSYIAYKMAEGLSARFARFGQVLFDFPQIKTDFPLAGTLT